MPDALEVYGELPGHRGPAVRRLQGHRRDRRAAPGADRRDPRRRPEVMLEVVSEARRRRAALDRGGASTWASTGSWAARTRTRHWPILAGSGLRYCPFPGTVIGHPSLLRGTVESIAADAARLTALDGVHGLDLLAYRFDGDVQALVAAVVAASRGPGHRRRQRRLRRAHPDARRAWACGATPSAAPSSRASCRAARASPTRSARCSHHRRADAEPPRPLTRPLSVPGPAALTCGVLPITGSGRPPQPPVCCVAASPTDASAHGSMRVCTVPMRRRGSQHYTGMARPDRVEARRMGRPMAVPPGPTGSGARGRSRAIRHGWRPPRPVGCARAHLLAPGAYRKAGMTSSASSSDLGHDVVVGHAREEQPADQVVDAQRVPEPLDGPDAGLG